MTNFLLYCVAASAPVNSDREKMIKSVLVLALVASALAVPAPKPEAKPDPKADPQFSRVSVTSGQTPYAYSVAHVPAAYYGYPGAPFSYSGYPGYSAGYPAAPAPYYNPYSYQPYGYNPYSAFRYY